MPTSTERDIMVVQDKLAELYATLSPAQQDVLDMIMAAGLSLVDDDAGGYVMVAGPAEMETMMRSRIAELQEDFRRTNTGSNDETSGDRTHRWNLRGLFSWLNRPQPRPA